MSAKADELLGDVQAVGLKGDFLSQACFVHRPAVEQLGDRGAKAIPLAHEPRWRAHGDELHRAF
jgi:hypothetical protein